MRDLIERMCWLRPLNVWSALGRIFGVVVCGFWLLMGVGSAVGEPEPFTWESAGVVFFILATTAATTWAWFDERRGGGLLVILAVGFSIFALFSAGRNHAFAMLISGGPFLVIGLLFLASWRIEQKRAR